MMMPPCFAFHSHTSFEKLLPAQVVAGLAFLAKLPLDDVLRRDPGVIRPGQPENLVPQHPRAAGENILDRVIEHVPEGRGRR